MSVYNISFLFVFLGKLLLSLHRELAPVFTCVTNQPTPKLSKGWSLNSGKTEDDRIYGLHFPRSKLWLDKNSLAKIASWVVSWHYKKSCPQCMVYCFRWIFFAIAISWSARMVVSYRILRSLSGAVQRKFIFWSQKEGGSRTMITSVGRKMIQKMSVNVIILSLSRKKNAVCTFPLVNWLWPQPVALGEWIDRSPTVWFKSRQPQCWYDCCT